MAQSICDGDLYVRGNLTSNTQTIPAGTVTNAMVNTAAAIAATKLVHQFPVHYGQVGGTDVTSATMPVHIVQGLTGSIVSFQVMPITAPTGGDKKFTVDLKKSTGAGAYASVLSGGTAYTVDSSKASLTVYSTTVATTSLVVGDTLEIVITASGSTGSQGQGVVCTAMIREDPA